MQHNRGRHQSGTGDAQAYPLPGHARDRGSRRGRHVHRRRPDRRGTAGDGQGRDHRGRPVARASIEGVAPRAGRGGPRRRATWPTSATARRSPRTRCSSGAARARPCGHARLRRRARRSAARPGRTSTGPSVAPPAPLAEVTAEVDERMGPDGVLRRLDPRVRVERAARRLRRARRRGGRRLPAARLRRPAPRAGGGRRPAAGAARTCTSSRRIEVAAEFREYERASTDVADAYLGPVAGRYLRRLAASRGRARPARARVMQSSGGVCDLDEAAAHPARLLLSGPAGGVAAVVGARASATRSASTWAAPRPTSA